MSDAAAVLKGVSAFVFAGAQCLPGAVKRDVARH
jgi:hypothetical protein